MCLEPRISNCASGNRSRSSLIDGRVRTKSPIAPPRMTRMRFIETGRDQRSRLQESVTRHRAAENSCAEEKDQAESETPTAIRARRPTNLISEETTQRDRD